MPECGVSAGVLFRLFDDGGGFCEVHERVVSFQKAVLSGRGGAPSGWGSPGRCAVRSPAARSGRGWAVRRQTAAFEALQQHMQFLRGALAGPYEVDEILSGVFHVQQHIAVVVQYDVLPEYLHSLFDVRLQQAAIAAVHAGHVQPGTFFGEFVYQRMPGFDGSGCCLG